MRPSDLLVLILAAAAGCGSSSKPAATPVAAAHPVPRERLAPCDIPGVTEKLLCGKYSVWENRTTRQGRKIDLNVIVVPALDPNPAPDAVFAFAGGPGDSAGNAVRGFAQDRVIRAHRDIVLVDQRGTGSSHRLDCKIPKDRSDVQAYFEPTLPPAEVRRCREALEADADLTQYTTSIAADDLDEVRAWLGYDKINLQGGSYGTRAAQVYLRRHGDHVRSALLIGVVGMNQYLPLYHARDGKRALDLVFEACARDPVCAAAFPDLPGDNQKALARLERERARATVHSPVDKHEVAVTIPRDVFAEQIRFLLYNAVTATVVPYIIHRAAEGDFDPYANAAMVGEPALRDILAYGMHLSVTCAEDVPFFPPDDVEGLSAGTYLQGYRVKQQIAACKEWRRGEIPADYHKPVTSDVPVLLISGPYDPVTPPRWAEEAAPHFSHGLHVVIPEAHHGPGGLSHEECFVTMAARFYERGSAEGLDTSCVSTMKPPPFVTTGDAFAALLAGADN